MLLKTIQAHSDISCIACSYRSGAFPALKSLQHDRYQSPSILNLLNTNTEPMEVEHAELKKDLPQAIKEFDEFSSRVETLTAWLASERARLEDTILKQKGAVSAMRRIPNEVLGRIFTAAVDQTPVEDRLYTNMGAWPLSKVCSRWRDVALSIPSLWSTIEVVATYSMQEERFFRYRTLAALDAALDRSSKTLLDISIDIKDTIDVDSDSEDGSDDGSDKDDCPISPAFEMILKHAPRFRSLLVGSRLDECSTLYYYISKIQNLPSLERITLHIDTDFDLEILANAPRLRHASLKIESFYWNPPPLLFLDSLLAPCTKLETLSITSDFTGDGGDPQKRDIRLTSELVLPNLHTLIFTCAVPPKGLRLFTLPSLSNLTLRMEDSESRDRKELLLEAAAIIEKTSCRLNSLTIDLDGQVNADAYRTLFQAASTIKELWITTSKDLREQVFSWLTIDPASLGDALCPKLQFVIIETNPLSFWNEELEDSSSKKHMIESRRAHCRPNFMVFERDGE